jgi:hypothetical protein
MRSSATRVRRDRSGALAEFIARTRWQFKHAPNTRRLSGLWWIIPVVQQKSYSLVSCAGYCLPRQYDQKSGICGGFSGSPSVCTASSDSTITKSSLYWLDNEIFNQRAPHTDKSLVKGSQAYETIQASLSHKHKSIFNHKLGIQRSKHWDKIIWLSSDFVIENIEDCYADFQNVWSAALYS